MKTYQEFQRLFPAIISAIANLEHEIGFRYCDIAEDGCCRHEEHVTNHYCYDEDGWQIEITYECCGEWVNDNGDYWTPPSTTLISASGEVAEIIASHYDEETGEKTEFSGSDLDELWKGIDNILEDIA